MRPSVHAAMDETHKFLAKLQAYPILYDANHPQYLEAKTRRKVWADVGKPFQLSSDAARLRFKHLKDSYFRAVRAKRVYRYHDLIQPFTDARLKERHTRSCSAAAGGSQEKADETLSARDHEGEMDNHAEMLVRIRAYPELWDHSNESFHDTAAKMKIWHRLGKEFKISGSQAKRRFRNSRDSYMRSLKRPTAYRYHDYIAPLVHINGEPAPTTIDTSTAKVHLDSFSIDLLKAVECRPSLYNGQPVTTEMSDEIWEEVADNLQKSVRECKTRYQTMREELKKARKDRKFYPYDRYMEFLIPHLALKTPAKLKEEQEDQEEDEEDFFGGAEEASNTPGQSMDDFDVDMGDEEDSPSTEQAWVLEGGDQSEGQGHAQSASTEDPLKIFFASVHSMMRGMRASNVSRLQKQIFNLVIEMQITEQEEQK